MDTSHLGEIRTGYGKRRNKPLRLQVEHINGDRLDCRAENLCFLCPNCHTQTATYARCNGTLLSR
ncbi:HNH endonuclease [Actinoallomurus sp. CA-150999]|uniref:HNH endonuclease n=1 Tax=Actinoallomurus sp. CA-150999 TaxID=3239887 RepID=UPI003D9375AB